MLMKRQISRVFFQPADQSDASNTVVNSEAKSGGAGVEDDCDSRLSGNVAGKSELFACLRL